jgi:hypothetical protein
MVKRKSAFLLIAGDPEDEEDDEMGSMGGTTMLLVEGPGDKIGVSSRISGILDRDEEKEEALSLDGELVEMLPGVA